MCVVEALKFWGISLRFLIIPCLGSDYDKGKELKNKSSEPFSPQLSASCLANLWFLIGEKGNEEIWLLTLLESGCIGNGSAVWV